MVTKAVKTTKLCQIIAIESGEKTRCHKAITELYQGLSKSPQFVGLSRTYVPDNDEGEVLPSESTLVQQRWTSVLEQADATWRKLWDITATKEWGNTLAVADVVVDGAVIVPKAPVTYLLFLEKQLTDLHTLVSSFPVLDPAEEWTFDETKGWYTSRPVETVRTRKVKKVLTLAPPTDKHPAQAQAYDDDVPVGRWTTTKFSGAVSADVKERHLQRIEALQTAVKFAREEANSIEVQEPQVADAIWEYLREV